MRIIDYFFISVTEGVICKIKMNIFGLEREILAYTNLMENRLPIFRNNILRHCCPVNILKNRGTIIELPPVMSTFELLHKKERHG